MKLVVAMEVGTFCEGPNKAHKIKGGLCSGIELQDAEYDSAGQRVVSLVGTGGGALLHELRVDRFGHPEEL